MTHSFDTGKTLATAALFVLAGASGAFAADDEIAPLPGFQDLSAYNRTPIVGVEAGASLIRLANMRDEGEVTNYVEIYGLDTRETLASFEVKVPAKASIEFRPEQMVQTFAPVNYDQPLVLYVENGRERQLWQHLKTDERLGLLVNASACSAAPHVDYLPYGPVALNVLAGGIGRVASFVTAHNFSDVEADFEARLYEAKTGRLMGSVDVTLRGRETLAESGLWFFHEAGLVSTGEDQQNFNIEFVPVDPDTPARLVVTHELYDMARGFSVNLSSPCTIHGGIITIPPLPAPQ